MSYHKGKGEDFVRSLQSNVSKPYGVPPDAIFMTVSVNWVKSKTWIWKRQNKTYLFNEGTGQLTNQLTRQ